MLVKNGKGLKDVPVSEITADNYVITDDKERGLYHCKIEMRRFDASTGKTLSRPRIQKFGKKVFETNIVKNLTRQGYTIDVLYNPTEYLKEQAIKRADLAKEAQKAKDAALHAKIDAGIKEGIAKYIAEHGVADATDKTTSEPDKNDPTEKAGKNNK